jgi:hypothetical protein
MINALFFAVPARGRRVLQRSTELTPKSDGIVHSPQNLFCNLFIDFT